MLEGSRQNRRRSWKGICLWLWDLGCLGVPGVSVIIRKRKVLDTAVMWLRARWRSHCSSLGRRRSRSWGPSIVLDVLLLLEGDGELAHSCGSHHDIRKLFQAPEDVLPHIGDPIFPANVLNKGLGLLVGQHGQVGPEVVLHLVVEESMHEVVQVSTCCEVRTGNNLAQEKGPGVGLSERQVDRQALTRVPINR